MLLYELFSGTGSIGRPWREAGHTVVAFDIDPRFNPEMLGDVMQVDYKSLPVPDVVWASPPCIMYSVARSTGQPTDLNEADVLVAKTLEMIQYWQGRNPDLKFFMENPDSGKLKHRPIVKDLPFVVLDYCMYNGPGYRKRTRIWTNTSFVPRPLCDLSCSAPKHGKTHWYSAQKGGQRHRDGSYSSGFTTDQLHALPRDLCDDLLSFCERDPRE